MIKHMAYYNMTINNKNNNQTIMWQKGNKKNRQP